MDVERLTRAGTLHIRGQLPDCDVGSAFHVRRTVIGMDTPQRIRNNEMESRGGSYRPCVLP